MKKLLIILGLLFLSSITCMADETAEVEQANQVIKMEDNKINVIVMKQPMNENSNQ